MMDIPLGMRQIDSPEGSGYYSKSAPATILNSFRIINSTSHYCFYSTLIRKARGQVTVASLFTDIMTNHCKSRWKQYSPRVKAEFSVISAASDAPYSLFKGAHSSVFSRLKTSTLPTEVHSLSSKGFHSRNTLEVAKF